MTIGNAKECWKVLGTIYKVLNALQILVFVYLCANVIACATSTIDLSFIPSPNAIFIPPHPYECILPT